MTPDLDSKVRELENWHDHFEWRYVADHYEPRRVLDFGCGYGYGDIYLAREGFCVVGYDISEERIGVAQHLRGLQSANIQDRLTFCLSAIFKWNYELVWISHVLEHIPLALWPHEFDLIQLSCETDDVPILVSVPLGHAYDTEEHVNHWDTAEVLASDLISCSGLPWRAWEDREHLVIKATQDSKSPSF
jgi:SAM-dependent methyltransferase